MYNTASSDLFFAPTIEDKTLSEPTIEHNNYGKSAKDFMFGRGPLENITLPKVPDNWSSALVEVSAYF